MMKRVFIAANILASMLLAPSASQAQKKEPVPEEGAWQLVSNRNDPSKVTVQFYTGSGVLMHEETLYDVRLNIKKKRTVRKLNAALLQVHQAWLANRSATTGTYLVANRFQP